MADQVSATPIRSNVVSTRPGIQRVARPSSDHTEVVPASVEQTLGDSGRSLAPAVQRDMEHRFGHDFSRVRVHRDAQASQSARDIDALAYTSGHHIVFGAGQYAPHGRAGIRLLAHELVHVIQQQGTSSGTIQRAMDPACAPFVTRNKAETVCKEPPPAAQLGSAAHTRIQTAFKRPPDQLTEVPIPGAGNVCSEGKFEPAFSRGKADLVKVLSRDETVQLEIGEIKPLNVSGLSLGPSQLECYQRHLSDVGKVCETLTQKVAEAASKDPTAKFGAEMCVRLNALGKKVKVSKTGLTLPPQNFNLYGRPMTALTCFPGVICYSCMDPEQESRADPEAVASLAIAGPGGTAAAGFVIGFLAGAKRTVPNETWTRLYETLSQPVNQVEFQGGILLGRPLGLAASLQDFVEGVGALLKLSVELSAPGIVAAELSARFKGEESPTVRRARMARDIVKGLPEFFAEVKKNPGFFADLGEEIGNLCGEEAGRKFLKEFVAANPFQMGLIVGKVQGYLVAEVALLLVGAEELVAAGKGVSAAAKAAKASRFGQKILEILEKVPALKRLLDAMRGASRVRVAAEVAEATKAREALKAREAQRAIEKERELKALEEAAEEAQSAKRAMRR